MPFVLIAECGAMGYDRLDLCIVHGGCCVIILLSNVHRRRIDQNRFAQFLDECSFDPGTTYMAY